MSKEKKKKSRSIIHNTEGYLDVHSKLEIWKQLGQKFKGTFKITHTAGNVLEIHRLSIPYKHWELKFSESDTQPLKLEAIFKSRNNYQLTLSHEDFIEKILKKLGKKEIEINNKDFDDKYLIESNDEYISTKFLSKEITDLILKYNIYSLHYTTDIIKDCSKLQSVVSRTIEKLEEYIEIITLYIKIIDKLHTLNLIS